MSRPENTKFGCHQYELEVAIEAPRERVWRALINETNAWWLPDFHMVGEDSVVEFDLSPGGRGLVEHLDGGGFLVWYQVQFFIPDQFTLHMVGNLGPDWGGPATTNMKLQVDETESGSVVKISDAHHGRISGDNMESQKAGWTQLFTDGLASYVEKSTGA